MTSASNPAKTVLICQNTTCRKTGSAKVLAAFRSHLSSDTSDTSDGAVMGCGCLGQCGNGPTVLVMPNQVWYHRVHPNQVAVIVQRHFPQPC